MRLELEGTNVLLTGASSGIGRELARLLAPRVARLILVARRVDRLQELKNELRAQNARLEIDLEPCDLGDAQAASVLADKLLQRGAVDVLINNAGFGDFVVYDLSDWSRIAQLIALNVTAVALLTRKFVAPMVARGRGGILNISSSYGLIFSPGMAAYCGSKHFVTGFTESLRLDLAGTGVVVSQCCPGPVKTEFNDHLGDASEAELLDFLAISGPHCARAALRGFERGRAMIVPGLLMKVLKFFLAITPRWLHRLVQVPFGKRFRRKALN